MLFALGFGDLADGDQLLFGFDLFRFGALGCGLGPGGLSLLQGNRDVGFQLADRGILRGFQLPFAYRTTHGDLRRLDLALAVDAGLLAALFGGSLLLGHLRLADGALFFNV